MVGFIQKILCDLILSIRDEETLKQVKTKAQIPLDRIFKINTAYSNEEWQRLWDAALEVLEIPQEKAIELYADAFCKDAMKRFPMWFKMSKNSYEFIIRQPAIHNSFSTGVISKKERQAILDKFRLQECGNNKLITHYISPNKRCDLYKALAKWFINHYQDTATIEEVKCMHLGDSECEIHIQWHQFGT